MIGRAYLYGLMAGGRAGVDRTIAILADQIVRTMKLLGVASLAELTPDHVTQLERLIPRAKTAAAEAAATPKSVSRPAAKAAPATRRPSATKASAS